MKTHLIRFVAFGLTGACSTSTPGVKQSPPVLEPATQAFVAAVEAQAGPPIYKLSVEQARALLDGAQQSEHAPIVADVREVEIPGGPTGTVSLRIVRPAGSTDSILPAVMYFHGGGWILGNANTHDRLVRKIAKTTNAAVVFVNYSPSPEARFPIAIEQAYAATKYIAAHGERFRLDGSRLAVAGDSVGGNMAAVVAMVAKQRGGPSIAHQLLFYPVTDARMDNDSYRSFQDGPWLTKNAMAWFFDAYVPNPKNRANPLVSPVLAPVEGLRALPPATVITAENDVLRDEGEAYARRLMQAGVSVKSVRYNGTIHDFVMLNALASTPAAQSAVAFASKELRAALSN